MPFSCTTCDCYCNIEYGLETSTNCCGIEVMPFSCTSCGLVIRYCNVLVHIKMIGPGGKVVTLYWKYWKRLIYRCHLLISWLS